MPSLGSLTFTPAQASLFIGAVLLYIGVRQAAALLEELLTFRGGAAIGNWFGIAVAAIVALRLHRPDLSFGIVFCSSIACLSLVVGSVAFATDEMNPPGGRFWAFVLPAALLVFLAGLSGQFTWVHALLLILEGVMIFGAWQETPAPVPSAPALSTSAPPDPDLREAWLNALLAVLALAVVVIGAILAIRGILAISQGLLAAPASATVVALLGPILVMPMLVSGANRPGGEKLSHAISLSTAITLLNLCLLLPMLVVIWYAMRITHHVAVADVPALVFPLVTWRVDSVVLVLLAVVLIPVTMGRLRLGRAGGLTLVGLYAAYVLMEAVASSQL